MLIAVFENEYDSVRGAFEVANFINFNSALNIEVFPSANINDLEDLNKFSVIFIDIDLSTRSELDGYGLMQKIEAMGGDVFKKIVILTGNNKIQESLKQRNIKYNSILTIIKPTDYEEISNHIQKIINRNS